MKPESDMDNKEAAESLTAVALRERIESRAYHIWLAGGSRHGEALHHWLQAESEIMKAVSQDQAERASVPETSAAPKAHSSIATNATLLKK